MQLFVLPSVAAKIDGFNVFTLAALGNSTPIARSLFVSQAKVVMASRAMRIFQPVNGLVVRINLLANFIKLNLIVSKFSQTYLKKF